MVPQFHLQIVSGLEAAAYRHERCHRLAGQIIGEADHRGLGHCRVLDQATLKLGGAETVPGNVQDVVDSANDPVVAVFVAGHGITGQVDTVDLLEIGGDKAVALAELARMSGLAPALLVDAADHARPRSPDD